MAGHLGNMRGIALQQHEAEREEEGKEEKPS